MRRKQTKAYKAQAKRTFSEETDDNNTQMMRDTSYNQ